ncbi:MAG: type II toxin-antitoxin system VapC family toxin [Solirubrobacteraceae bacterium]
MTFFVDANISIYTWLPTAYREPCLEILAAIAAGDAAGCTSTAAIEEVWHFELSERALDVTGMTADAYALFKPLLSVTDDIFRDALALSTTRIGANDRIHVATCLANGIDTILSADRAFDAVERLRRVDPLDQAAVAELLGRE